MRDLGFVWTRREKSPGKRRPGWNNLGKTKYLWEIHAALWCVLGKAEEISAGGRRHRILAEEVARQSSKTRREKDGENSPDL